MIDQKRVSFAALFASCAVVACASVEDTNPPNKEARVPTVSDVSEPKGDETKACTVQRREAVRLLEPPFLMPVDQTALPPGHIPEYVNESYVLQYQVVEVDPQQFLDFLRSESDIPDRDCRATVELNFFKEGPIAIHLDRLHSFTKASSSIRGSWSGSSPDDAGFSYQFVLESSGGLSMHIKSESKTLQLNQAEFLPYHVLWEADTAYFGSTDN